MSKSASRFPHILSVPHSDMFYVPSRFRQKVVSRVVIQKHVSTKRRYKKIIQILNFFHRFVKCVLTAPRDK